MIPRRLEKFFKKHKVYYQILVHPTTFRSTDTAQAGNISGKGLAKVVMAKAEGKDVMLVLPSHRTVDLLKLSAALGTQDVRIEEEREFKDLFPDCEVGAMPPFGKLYHLPCYVDDAMGAQEMLFFNGGNHAECVQIATQDFLRVVKASSADFSVPGKKVAEKGLACSLPRDHAIAKI